MDLGLIHPPSRALDHWGLRNSQGRVSSQLSADTVEGVGCSLGWKSKAKILGLLEHLMLSEPLGTPPFHYPTSPGGLALFTSLESLSGWGRIRGLSQTPGSWRQKSQGFHIRSC